MVLTVDIGNSITTLALFHKDGTLFFQAELNTAGTRTDDSCAIDLKGVCWLYDADIPDITGSIVSSVVPPVTSIYQRTLTRLTGKPPLVMGPGFKTGLNIKADIHSQLGSDIVASAVAAAALYPTPTIIINSRTAVTFSYLSGEGFEGCSIMPGVELALDALSRNGAQLPHISLTRVDTPLGRNTVDAMRAGVLYGYSGAFDRVIDALEEAAGTPAAAVVVTGTSISALYRLCRREITYDENLAAKGLYLLYRKNARQ